MRPEAILVLPLGTFNSFITLLSAYLSFPQITPREPIKGCNPHPGFSHTQKLLHSTLSVTTAEEKAIQCDCEVLPSHLTWFSALKWVSHLIYKSVSVRWFNQCFIKSKHSFKDLLLKSYLMSFPKYSFKHNSVIDFKKIFIC